jgi:phosphatidate cytidylyltransferase
VPALAERGGAGGGADRWSDLRLRVVSALVLAPAALACLWAGGLAWALLVVAATAGLAREWLLLWPRHWLGQAAGLAWIGVAAVSLLWLRADPADGRVNVIFLLLGVWASDIGAYLAGRLIGGKRLAPQISPGKTWAGALGGLAATALVGVVVAAASGAGGLARAAGVAAGLSILAQAGDLLESAAKRRAGVKDSGGLIPGHGGLLDRLDGLLAASPAAALLALALGRGVMLWQ